MAKKNDNKADETPESYGVRGTPRNEKEAGKYPNYFTWKDRSGNNWGADASKGNESMWFQHRSGTAVEMHPDGALHITAHNSKYEVIFGEDRITISGARDITVKGDASLRVYGDYNVTCHKNYNLTVMGDYNLTSKNMNRHIRGNMDTQAKNVNKKVEGSINYQSHGAAAYVSKGATTIASQSDKLFAGGAAGFHASVAEGDMSFMNEKGDMFHETKDGKSDQKYASNGKEVKILHKDGKTDHTSDEQITTESKNSGITTKAMNDITTKTTTGGIKLAADAGSISADAQQNLELKTQSGDAHLTAGGHAAMEGGGGTTVGNATQTTNVVGGGSGVNIEPLSGMLNLAPGGISGFGGLGQLAFDFLQGDQAEGVQDRRSTRADQPMEEADASSWIDSLKST